MKYALFVKLFISIAFGFIIITILTNIWGNSNKLLQNNTHIIRIYQMEKMTQNISNDLIETIVVGDSSAGNAIDAKYFSLLSSKQTLNLSLVGSYGIEGNINIIKHAKRKFPNLKNVLIIQTLDMWPRTFNYQGYFTTLEHFYEIRQPLTVPDNIYKAYFDYITNSKIIFWSLKDLIKKLFGKPSEAEIDSKYDYLKQSDSTYSNGKLIMNEKAKLPEPFIEDDQQNNYRSLDQYCYKSGLNCLFMHGPIHETLYKNSQEEIEKIKTFVNQNSRAIYPIQTIHYYENSKIGDSADHVHTQYKNESTLDYYNAVKDYLL